MPKTGFNLDLEARPEILSVIVAVANVCGVLAEEWAKHGVPLSVLPDAIRQVVETKGGKFN